MPFENPQNAKSKKIKNPKVKKNESQNLEIPKFENSQSAILPKIHFPKFVVWKLSTGSVFRFEYFGLLDFLALGLLKCIEILRVWVIGLLDIWTNNWMLSRISKTPKSNTPKPYNPIIRRSKNPIIENCLNIHTFNKFTYIVLT